MAQYLLVSILITEPEDETTFDAGDVLKVLWDDSTEQVVCDLNGSPFTLEPSNLGHVNTNFTIIEGITSSASQYMTSGYSFCDGTSLVWFQMLRQFPVFPYMQKVVTPDSPVCAVGGGPVCDIGLVGPIQVTHSLDRTTGGSIKFTPTSSNGPIKYSIRDFDYATGGTLAIAGENTRTGLIPGSYSLYLRDANDCLAVRNFTILFKPIDQEHFRFTWASLKIGNGESRDARVRIYEREYTGSVVEIDYGHNSPFVLSKPKPSGTGVNNKFAPVHPSNAVIVLASISDYQFLPLFTQDNRKYRVVYEVDEGSGFIPVWQGFIDPNVYREDFTRTPYFVEIYASDGLAIIKFTPFTDDNGALLRGNMKLIKVLAMALKKSGLSMQIQSGINIFEMNHDTGEEDDPLDQTYIDVACYRNKDGEPFTCGEVLEAILKPFGARILQYDGRWIIEEIDKATESYAYRLFSANGDYESNSTFDPIIDVEAPTMTDRAALVSQDHSLEVIPAYGKIDVVSQLNYIGSIVAGGFEITDLLSPDSETFSDTQGIFTSEEGFRDWTLRYNGTSGVSFGRIEVSRRGDSARTGLQNVKDEVRSVGAFFYNPNAWNGNLRNAYLESAAKDYEYGPGDILELRFDYSSPASTEYEFMVLRVMIKVGNQYLQPDKSWDTAESIYRSYPAVSNSLAQFELSVPAPETDVIVDTTVQVRIYFYSPNFYDHGLPTNTNNVGDGTEGEAGLKAIPTAGLRVDYRSDIRSELNAGLLNLAFREFYELLVGDPSGDNSIEPDDYDNSTNRRYWQRIKSVNMTAQETRTRRRGADLKFYIDNVALDALINGQPPPEEDRSTLEISKYITENIEVDLYHFDVPNIVNAKNMYNNYFKLDDGTPTSKWARKDIPESLPLQSILLKVLGGNHAAPTFKLTGSFINEFSRIGPNNYLRITKPGSDLVMSNTDFETDLTGWAQSATPLLGGWAWSAENGGCAEATLSGADDSKTLYQEVDQRGGYIEVGVSISAIPAADNTREDVLFLLFYQGSSIVHTEKLTTFSLLTSVSLKEFKHIAYCQGSITRVGLFIKSVSGSGSNTYQLSEFSPVGKDLQEIYQITDYQNDERLNTYTLELMQLSKTYVSLAAIDTGGNNQSGGTSGREHSSAYSSAYS